MIISIKPTKVTSVLARTQNTILSAAFVISVASAVNALLGFVKSRLLAYHFGVSHDLAIFYTADKIPNLIYSVLVVGALSTVFIPVFTTKLKENKDEAFKMASSIISATMGFFLILGILIFIFARPLLSLISLNRFTPDELALGINLMRIMIISQVFLVGGSLVTSVLQSFKYFLIPALAPVVYNLGMILGIVFLSPSQGIYGPTWGVLLGTLLYLGIQVPLVAKTGFHFSARLNFKDKGLLETLKLVPPRLISVFMANVMGTVNNSLAILVSTSSVVFLKFATQLQTFPVTLFGLSIAAASLPTLSETTHENNFEKFKKTFTTSFHQTMFLVIPLSVILLVLRVPVVRIVYGVSNFPWEATVQTSYILAFFSISIFAQSANYLITRAFYALKDTKTPVLINTVTVVLNIGVSILLVVVLKLGVWAVALSFSATAILDMILYLYFLSRKTGGFVWVDFLRPFVKISYAALFMGVTLYLPLKLLDQFIFDTTKTIELLALTAVAGMIGLTTYLVLTKLFRVTEIELFYKIMRKLKLMKSPVPAPISENMS